MAETTELEKAAVPAQEPAALPPKKPKKKRKLKKWVVLGVLVLAAGLIGYSTLQAAMAKPVVYYEAASVRDIDSTLSVSGTLTAAETRSYFVPGSVKVAKVNFKKGDAVKAGEVIAAFDLSDLQVSLEKARLNLENAQLQYEDTMDDLDNSSQELYDVNKEIRKLEAKETTYKLAYDYFNRYPTGDREIDGLIEAYGGGDNGDGDSSAMYDAWQGVVSELTAKMGERSALRAADLSENNQKVLDNNLALQQIEYDEIAKMVNESQGGIVAEFDGIVTDLSLVEGATVSAGMDAVTVASTEGVLLRFSVGKFDVDRIQVGQPAQVTFGSKELTGTVTHLDGAATLQTTGTTTSTVLQGEITVEDPDGVLKLGMDADADILTAQAEGAVAVPVEAVKTDKDGDYVYTVAPSANAEEAQAGIWQLRKVYVTSGIFDDSYIQITQGLSEGDLVCTSLPSSVEDGALVTALPTGETAALLAQQAAQAAGGEG